MSVLTYLNNIASSCAIETDDQQAIERSISTLKTRLTAYFGSDISSQFKFGSSTRKTMLPKEIDADADIDYMVVFNDGNYRPQTYLDKLKRFVEIYYGRSEIYQSNPTIVLKLNHIKFELVPALYNWLNGYRIPAKSSDLNDWISTKPLDFNSDLDSVNQANNYIVKPLIRLMKYWNVKKRKVFQSYELEKLIVDAYDELFGISSYSGNVKEALYYLITYKITSNYSMAQWKKDAINNLKITIQRTKEYEDKNFNIYAEAEIAKAFPQ